MTFRRRTALAGSLSSLLLVALMAAPASAAPPERFSSVESSAFDGEVCGVPTHVVDSESVTGAIHQRSGSYPYYWAKITRDAYLTRTSTGRTVHLHQDMVQRDARITDNGDGTIDILVAGTYTEFDHAPDGTVGLRTQGRETYVVTLDTQGTPTDEDDDVEIGFQYLGFTGHDDRETTDFCAWYLAVTA
jgi:hypothetical protein